MALYVKRSGAIPSTFIPASRSSARRQSPPREHADTAVLKLNKSGCAKRGEEVHAVSGTRKKRGPPEVTTSIFSSVRLIASGVGYSWSKGGKLLCARSLLT